MQSIHIIFDLDETLVFCPDMNDIVDGGLDAIFLSCMQEHVYLRPGWRDILLFCRDNMASVSIWSAAHRKYVNEIASYFSRECGIKFKIVYTSDNVSRRYNKHNEDIIILKLLSKLYSKKTDMNSTNTFIVDDSEETFSHNSSNAIHAKKFNGSKDDRYLYDLIEIFKEKFSVSQVHP